MIGRNFTNYPYYQLLRFSFYQKKKERKETTTTKENILTVWLWILYSFSYKQTLIDNTDTVCTYPQCVFTHSRIQLQTHYTWTHRSRTYKYRCTCTHTDYTSSTDTDTQTYVQTCRGGPSCCGRSVRLTVAEKDPKESQRCPWQGRTAWGSPWWHCQLLFSSSLL